MQDTNPISNKEKEEISDRMFELYDPDSIGQIEKYPPHGEYHVTLYYNAELFSIGVSNRYNHPVDKDNDRFLCDFELSNMHKAGNELAITLKVTKQN